MAMSVTISPGILILLLYLQIISAQQFINNGLPKTASGLNQIAQNPGLNCNSNQQANLQPMNFQQQSNIQPPFTQQTGNLQSQLNLQQANFPQPVNSISNSQLPQQQSQNLISDIFSALQNIKQFPQNQGANCGKVNLPQQTSSCGLKPNVEQLSLPQLLNQPSSAYTMSVPIINSPQANNQPSTVSNSFVESPQFQPTFTFHPVSSAPSQNTLPCKVQNQQNFAPPNAQNQVYYIQNQPLQDSTPNQQAIPMQSPMVIPALGSQTNAAQNQPIVFTLQPPQSIQSQPAQPKSQTNANPPIIYTVQTQPSPSPNQNQKVISNQPQGYKAPMDQSLISYVMSQMQNSQGSNSGLSSILPTILNTKSEKSSSMKTILPLILNMLNERKGGCVCPHCGCNNNQNMEAPVINSGYSNQKVYNEPQPVQEILSKLPESGATGTKPATSAKDKNNEITDNSTETSDEEEEYVDEGEDDSEEDEEN